MRFSSIIYEITVNTKTVNTAVEINKNVSKI